MDHREINAAADEISRIIALDPDDIDDAAIAAQYDRWQQGARDPSPAHSARYD